MAQQYRPLFKLDSGGMAEVYVAEAEALAGFTKRVAIKRILPGLLKDDRFVRMFLDEARLSLHLTHANIVSVFDIGKSDNTYFIVMEYVEGSNLKALLEYAASTGQRIPVPLTVWILNEILKGLDYAHNLHDEKTDRPLGIVHRDISPPNILISWNGEVKLVDFGLAKATTQLESTDAGVVKGKFAYLSPEAAHGLDVDARTDIFAVGIIGYEMLTGQRLFLGETDYQTVEKVRAAEVPSIRGQNPDVPEDLETILRKSLARDVNERYETCADFADDLLGVLFSHGLKVSSRDLRGLLARLRQAKKAAPAKVEPDSTAGNLIMELLQEEMMNFKSIDEDSDSDSDVVETGSVPLGGLGDSALPDFDPAAPMIPFERLDTGPSPEADAPARGPKRPAMATQRYPAVGVPPPPSEAAGDAEPPRAQKPRPKLPPSTATPALATSRLPSPAPKPEGGSSAWIVILLLIVAAGGGGAYYYFMVLNQ
jgi:serine/threonine-protein kinase